MARSITSITSSPKVLTITSPAKKGSVLPSFTIPPGWTSSPLSPVYHEEWDGPDSEGQTIARCHGLQPGKPVMEDNEAWTTIFLSGNKFYIWDRMDDGMIEIVSQDICEIARTISESELRELATKPKEEGDKPKDPEVKCVNTAYSKAVSVDVSLMRMLANKFCSGDKNKKRSQDLTAKDVSSSAYKYYKFHFELDPGKNSKFDCNAVFKSITGKCQGYDSHSIQSQGGAKIDDCGASFSYKITVPDKPKPKPDTVTQHGLQPRKCHTKDQFGSHGDVRGGELSMPRLDVLGSPMTRPN
ncbi:uncharacterized protein N7473_001337 [Penicillium subrubescens]|uniref:uncharacterized protein n=1 Tax=Penicillium subrubescens TaxID=1316194 RepID=UPI002544D6C8|nr:uncharacterized protein N7473_001337 [Penicillium subrubescens]KAJ5912034.1 hypothetical protein N7473_001337 [Penicillium subrubescens]